MLLSCNKCQKQYVASAPDSTMGFVCSNCRNRTIREAENTKLGIHPALARKLASTVDNRVSSPTLVLKTAHGALPAGRHKIDKLNQTSGLPTIPGYEISYQVGRGAMGSVFRARHTKTGRLVAIKVLSYELSSRQDLVARFEREAYALKSLNNPNVVTIIDAAKFGDLHYFAMEFIDGITLRTRINRGPVDWKEACFVAISILNGLQAAHRHGIIHRDLKPENVLMAYPDGDYSKTPSRVVLVDFGLVGIGGLVFDPHPNLTRSKVTMGTVNYMAPEQHIDAKRVDHRSDLYSCGVILFEMLTGELPLGRYSMPSEREENQCPVMLDEILAKALNRNLDERFSSAKIFSDELQKLLDLHSLVEIPQAKVARLNGFPWVKIHKKIRYGIMIAVAALFFALGIKMSYAQEAVSLPQNQLPD